MSLSDGYNFLVTSYMTFFNFFKKSFYLLAIFAIFFTFLMAAGLVRTGMTAAWCGLLMSYINFLAGASTLVWGFKKSDKLFYSAFFGGMLARFSIMFIILLMLFKYTELNRVNLILSLLVTYFSFLALEIWILHRASLRRGNDL